MEVEEAIRTRRTHKAYRPEPVDREQLEEILDLARWAPNHNLTNPWRFRVIGPQALERLKEAAGPGVGLQARPRADPGGLLLRAHRRSRSRTRRTCTPPPAPPTSSCSPPTAAGCHLLAHSRGPAHAGGAGRGRDPRRRALRRPAPPRQAGSGAAPARAARPPTRSSSSSNDLAERRAPGDPGAPLRRGRRRRRDHRRRRRARRRLARLLGGAARARRLRAGHLEPLLEDGPRRPPLPAELRPRPGPRGPARAPAAGPARAAPRLPDAVPGAGARREPPRPAHRHRAEHVRRDGDLAHRARAQPAQRALAERPTTGRRTATGRSPARRPPS